MTSTQAAQLDIAAHNATTATHIGARSDEEFRRGDPLRHAVFTSLVRKIDVSERLVAGCAERFTRGEDINARKAVLIRMSDGTQWIELSNGGGGLCSTEFFEARRASGATPAAWLGTRGKPAGFRAATIVTQAPVDEIVSLFAQHAGNLTTCGACGSAARQHCASCKAVVYCSTACQRAAWRHHRGTCAPA
jgi:hypothetical protein